MMADLNYTISLFLRAIGFYVKKFFFPMPLNFFIIEIDPLYDFLGIAVLLIVCHLIISKKLPSFFGLLGLLSLFPALPFAFGTIAWTAYAERYIYLSTAFWIVALCLWGGAWLERNPPRKNLVTALVVILCLTSACITFWRNIVWQSNATLMRDTVAQTPRIRKLRNIYIKALIDKGETGEALKQYQLAAAEVPSPAGDEQAALMVSGKLIREGRNNEALQLYQDAMQHTQFNSVPILKAAINLLRSMQTTNNVSKLERKRLAELLQKFSDELERIKQKRTAPSMGR
jgi:tetratricopeptide (TPR) repeat protein